MARRAVVLVSGGLDSMLALAVMVRQGIRAVAFHGVSVFSPRTDAEAGREALRAQCSRVGAEEVIFRDTSEAMLAFTRAPRFGYGKNMNACLDCRLMNIRNGRDAMKATGADFLVSGEVVGQRPMSQRRDALRRMDKEVAALGLEGLLVRPLSARLLPPTVPETEGWLDREALYDFQGRNRKPQMALAEALDLGAYQSPAGGCLLTDAQFCARLRDLLAHDPAATPDAVRLLRAGKHFRLGPEAKVIVSRREEENRKLMELAPPDASCYITAEQPGGIVLLLGPRTEGYERIAAGLAVYHSRLRKEGAGPVRRWTPGAEPATQTEIGAFPALPPADPALRSLAEPAS